MIRPINAENLDQIIIERIHRDDGEAQCVCEIDNKHSTINTAAVRITVHGNDGAVITDVWTRDQFQSFCRHANAMIADG